MDEVDKAAPTESSSKSSLIRGIKWDGKKKPHLSLTTLEHLIGDNLPVVMMITAPDDEPRTWYEPYEDIFDSENCLFDKKIKADHRNQLKL